MTRDMGRGVGWTNPLIMETAGALRLAESLRRGAGLRERAGSGWALGTFLIELPTAATVTSLGVAGFDFVVLDLEHSSFGFDSLPALILAADTVGLAVLVRPADSHAGTIGKLLDMGAHGIMVPHVESSARAREVVAQSRFEPRGQRGFSPLTRYDALVQPLAALDNSTYVVVQIEGRAGLEQAGEIASVPGIDAVFIGPYDLALSLGVQPDSQDVVAAAKRVAAKVPQGIQLGIYLDDPTRSSMWVKQGFTLQCVSFDGRMLADGARRVVSAARGGRPETVRND